MRKNFFGKPSRAIFGVVLLVLLIVAVAIATLALTKGNTIDDKTIVVGASPSPHAELLEIVREDIEKQGYKLKIVEFTDYVNPNLALQSGELDANFFQHVPYMEDFNKSKGTDLVSVAKIHYEPLGLYSSKYNDYNNLNGKKIAIPNDTTNCARALLLLDSLGIITVDKTKGLLATEDDITSNTNNIEIVALEAASLPSQLSFLDYAVINGNYVLSAGISITDTLLATESAESVAAETFANIISVLRGNEDKECIRILVEALTSDKVKQYIRETYNNVVLPYEN